MFLETVETPGSVWTPPVAKVAPTPVSFRQKFVTALRSGEWTQSRHIFYQGSAVCAVTLLFKLVERERASATLTWADGQDANYLLTLPLRQLNDGGGKSFAEIADYIEGLPR